MISADSGIAPASGALAAHDAPEWCSRWAGIGAHVRPESLLTIDRNGCSRCAGIRTISDFDKAISLKPDQAENYFQRGTARLIDGDFNAAISDFDRCIQLHSKYARAYLSRGVAHMHQANKREARRDFYKCLELKHEADLMLQLYILELETKIKERRTRRSSEGDRIALGSANNRDLS